MRSETREQWRCRVSAWQASGLTCRAYAEHTGLNPSTLSWWKWKLAREDEPDAVEPKRLGFVELATVSLERADTRLDLSVGDITVHVPSDFDPDTLHRLLDVLEARR